MLVVAIFIMPRYDITIHKINLKLMYGRYGQIHGFMGGMTYEEKKAALHYSR